VATMPEPSAVVQKRPDWCRESSSQLASEMGRALAKPCTFGDQRQSVRRSDDGVGRFLGGSSSTCKMVTTTGALPVGSARQPATRALDEQSGWPMRLRSWILGVVARSGRLPRRNCKDWLSCRRTSRCSGRSRRREIGVTSTNRSCGARAAERQGVRQARGFGRARIGRDSATTAGRAGQQYGFQTTTVSIDELAI
jgi:hypothetical protein